MNVIKSVKFLITNKLKSKISFFRQLVLKSARQSYLAEIAEQASQFTHYPEVCFVFQSHYAGNYIQKCLKPFIKVKVQNLLIFVDGCNDSTYKNSTRDAKGVNHLIITRNNTHEISNYRLSLSIAASMGCKYAVLLQDDDTYSNPSAWIDTVINRFIVDKNLAIVGLNGGEDLTDQKPKAADEFFSDALWWSSRKENGSFCGLGNYYEKKISEVIPSFDGKNFKYAASVNRAPQAINIQIALKLGFFPVELEPYQYDDDYNCFLAWENGYKILHSPILGKSSIREGGMRSFNSVTKNSRPKFHAKNFNFMLSRFEMQWASGSIQSTVELANENAGINYEQARACG